jgi:cytochrome P450
MTITTPDHVPPSLVVDVDLYNLPGGDVDPQTAWRSFQGRGPIVYSPLYGGFWVVTEGRDIARFLRDTKRLSSAMGVATPHHGGPLFVPLESDGAAHRAYRRNVEDFFSIQAIKKVEPRLRRDAAELVESVKREGRCDFVDAIANVYPMVAFLRLMDLPMEDKDYLHEIAAVLTKGSEAAAKEKATADLAAYLEKHIRERAQNPGDDPISRIAHATIDGRPYSPEEIWGTIMLLCAAGLDTTGSVTSFMALYLARNPDQRAYVAAHLDDLGPIVNEFLRRFPVANDSRVATEDIEYAGVTIRSGDRVYLPLPLYNLDEKLFDSPDQVNFARHGKHITFGTGPHTCVGAALARLEFDIFLTEWLTQIPDFEVEPGPHSVVLRASHNQSIDRLLLRWDLSQ